MLVIDVSFNVLKSIKFSNVGAKLFYITKTDTVEIYTVMYGIFYRHIYTRKGEEEDGIFFEHNMADSIQVRNISYFNEEPWQELFLKMNDTLTQILEKLKEIEEKD